MPWNGMGVGRPCLNSNTAGQIAWMLVKSGFMNQLLHSQRRSFVKSRQIQGKEPSAHCKMQLDEKNNAVCVVQYIQSADVECRRSE